MADSKDGQTCCSPSGQNDNSCENPMEFMVSPKDPTGWEDYMYPCKDHLQKTISHLLSEYGGEVRVINYDCR